MKKTVLALICLSFFVSGNSFAAKRPDWVKGKSKNYPKNKYLIGVGLDRDLDKARTKARAEIAKIFKSEVKQIAKDSETEENVTKGKKTSTEHTIKATVDTMIITNETLEGVEIAETWYHKGKAQHYALAVLDKVKMRTALAQEILDKEEVINSQMNIAEQAETPLEKIRSYSKALQAIKEKRKISIKKRVVDPATISDLTQGALTVKIEEKRQKEMNRIYFVLQSLEDEKLKEVASAKISDMGFKLLNIIPEKKVNVYSIKANVSLEQIERNNPNWKFYNWQVSVEFFDLNESDKTVASIVEKGQAAGLSDQAAKQKAEISARKGLSQAIEKKIQEYMFGK